MTFIKLLLSSKQGIYKATVLHQITCNNLIIPIEANLLTASSLQSSRNPCEDL